MLEGKRKPKILCRSIVATLTACRAGKGLVEAVILRNCPRLEVSTTCTAVDLLKLFFHVVTSLAAGSEN